MHIIDSGILYSLVRLKEVFCIWGYGGHVKDGNEERTMRKNTENVAA